MPKILITCALFFWALLGVHSTTLAAVQLGVEAELKNEQLNLDTANVNWWLTDNLALRGKYAWNTEEIGLAALYTLNPRSRVSLFLGLGGNDVTGNVSPELSPEEKAALIAGVEMNLSRKRSGLSLRAETQINAKSFLVQSGVMDGQAPRVGLSLNYRFSSGSDPVANATETAQDIEATESVQDTELLAKLIMLEAPDEPFEGQVAVAAVVLNRIRSNEFPDSVPDVIYQPGQFKPAPKLAQTTPSATAMKAAKSALQGSDPTNGALYFYNPDTCSETGRAFFKKHCQVTVRIGNHVFLK